VELPFTGFLHSYHSLLAATPHTTVSDLGEEMQQAPWLPGSSATDFLSKDIEAKLVRLQTTDMTRATAYVFRRASPVPSVCHKNAGQRNSTHTHKLLTYLLTY
jgi:hypothetical protein